MKRAAILTLFLVLLAIYIVGSGVQIYSSQDLSGEMIEARNGKLLVETVVGTVVDDEGNGKVNEPRDPDYDYISYRYVNGVEKGNTVVSLMLYNPSTDYVDDIIERFDYVMK